MTYHRKTYYKQSSKNDNFFEDVASKMFVFGFIGLVGYWFYNRSIFWNIVVYVIVGVIVVVLFGFLFLFIKRRRRESFYQKIDKMGFRSEVDNFIASFGHGQDKNASEKPFEYRGYSFDQHRIKDFVNNLKEKSFVINMKDFYRLLVDCINDKEYKRTIGGSQNVPRHLNDLNGTDFENLLCRLFERMGYLSKTTGRTGDQGGDLVIQKNQDRIVVQAKAYKDWSVGNNAVQQVLSAKNHYNCNEAWVVSTSEFTREAKEAAREGNVKLISKNVIQEWLLRYLGENWV